MVSDLWVLIGCALVVMAVGLYALMATRHLVRMLIALGLMTKGVMVLLMSAGFWGERMALSEALIITVIVVEVVVMVVGAGLCIGVFEHQGDLDLTKLDKLKG